MILDSLDSIAKHSARTAVNMFLSQQAASQCVSLFCQMPADQVWGKDVLGKNFTFGLVKPHGLLTNGIYAYIQHPRYSGLSLICVASFCLFLRLEGAVLVLFHCNAGRW